MKTKLGNLEMEFMKVIRDWDTASLAAVLVWYIGLFPGRAGYDPIRAINLMRNNQSTDWWTGWYFRILDFTTFGGKSIWLASLVSTITLLLSFHFFIYSLPISKIVLKKVKFIVCASPLFGNFAVTLGHDTFLTAALLLMVGLSFRFVFQDYSLKKNIYPFFVVLLLLTTKNGYLLLFVFICFLIIAKVNSTNIILLVLFSIATFLLSSVGISKSSVPLHLMPAIADIKCVVQHPEARISPTNWEFLKSINSVHNWKTPATCSSMDEALNTLPDSNFNKIDEIEFAQQYLLIFFRNPAIIIQAHLQRSSEALPPPFFQGPQNQVDRNISNPVGLNTNVALQLGPEVLHPSVDDPALKVGIPGLKYLEAILLLFSFLINQASWFWGWGGLWLWPTLMFYVGTLQIYSFKRIALLSYPLIANHTILFFLGPIPAPRYVMSTILIGFTMLLASIFFWFENKLVKGSPN